jgi:hypothetical protein
LSLLLLLSACGGKDAEKWLLEGHVYKADPSLTEIPDPVPETLLAEDRPIMRVIAGEEVEGPEEALARLTAAKENDLGLRTQVERLALREVPLVQVAALLSEMSGYNIAVTRRAAETPVNLYLQNLPLRQALEAVCRLNNLWYREDERIVTIMTVEEYGEEMVVRRNEKSPAVITVFKRNNAIIARSLDETILEDIGRVIELMDTPTSQVLLEISILQLNLGDGFESFFNLDVPGAYEYAYPDNMSTNMIHQVPRRPSGPIPDTGV